VTLPFWSKAIAPERLYVPVFAVSPLTKKTNCPEIKAGPPPVVDPPPDAVVMETLSVATAERVLVDVAVITTLPAVPGAVYVVLAPLAVWAGLNDPQDPDGLQLHSTPAPAPSFETVAAIDAVPPAFSVVGEPGLMATETDPPLPLGDTLAEPTAPHPEKLITKRKRIISARSVLVKFLRL
jgi:hypothetical protein